MKATLYKNGRIFTADKEKLYADAMLVADGKIRWVGEEKEFSEGNFPIEIVDLLGKRVIPGFVDAHMHPVMLADCSKQIAALPPKIHSLKELVEEIKRVRANTKEDQWILGWGYDEGKYTEQKAPDRYVLDEGCSDRPVCILRTCAHIRAVNSKALELAGIDRNTPDPVGGEIERDADGEPTGILKENARNLVTPFINAQEREVTVLNIRDLGELMFSQGITAVCDMGSMDHTDNYYLYQDAVKIGFKQKVGIYYFWDDYMDNTEFSLTREKVAADAQIFPAGLKLIGDGSVSGQTAYMERPYLGSEENYGMPVYTEEMLETAIAFCKKHQCQLSLHAMGGKAIQRALDRVCQENSWTKEGLPHVRMEHVTDPSIESIEKAIAHGIGFVTQPIFMYAEIESYLKNLGKEWMQTCYPVKKMLDMGVQLCFSTDAPATAWAVPSDPFPCIKGAVTRKAYDGTDCGQEQKVDIETALCLYTREAAKIAGFKRIGELKEGYQADFVVLDRDILTIPAEEIDQVKVLKTYINGKCEYSHLDI